MCVITDAKVYSECHDPAKQVLSCPTDTSIVIHSAEVRFEGSCNRRAAERMWRRRWTSFYCIRTLNDQPITRCNGTRSCQFRLGVLNYKPSDEPCTEIRHANYIEIVYNCTESKSRCCSLFSDIARAQTLYTPIFLHLNC